MATAANPYDYDPIPVPPVGGLLQTAVGTPGAPQPPIDPNTYENDDVVGQLNAITSADSGYMQLARTSGLQTANRRGLLNTSIAAGASQAAAIAAAAPLASQNASQSAQRNLTRLGAHFTGEQQQADIASREKMLDEQLASEEARLGRQLTSQELQQQRDIANRLEMQGYDLTAQKFMQQQQIAATDKLTKMNIDAESERLGRTLTAQEQAQIRELSAQQANLKLQLANNTSIANLQEAGATSRANLDAQTRIQLEHMSNLSEEQKATLAYYLQEDQIYAQSVSNLYANEALPAPARDAAIQQFNALKNAGVNLPGTLFGLDLSWGAPTPPGTPAPTPTTPPPTTTPVPVLPRPPVTGTTTHTRTGGVPLLGGGGGLPA